MEFCEFEKFEEGCVVVIYGEAGGDAPFEDEDYKYEIDSIQAYYQEDTDPVCFSRVEVNASVPQKAKDAEDGAGEWLRDELTAQEYSVGENFKEKAIDYIFKQTEMDEDDKDKIEVLPECYEDDEDQDEDD